MGKGLLSTGLTLLFFNGGGVQYLTFQLRQSGSNMKDNCEKYIEKKIMLFTQLAQPVKSTSHTFLVSVF